MAGSGKGPNPIDIDIRRWRESGGLRSIELSVMNSIGILTVIIVSGFSIYRFIAGDPSGGLINAAIVVILSLSLILGRFRRLQSHALWLFGLTITLSCLLSALLVSTNGLLWAYLVLWINTLILPRWLAVLFNTIVIATLSSHLRLFGDPLEQISWTVVALLVSGVGLVFTGQLRRQRAMLSRLATLDPLTGAGNRRLMQHDIENCIRRHRRNQRPSSLLVLDLDHFKKINDNHGHESGDQVLAEFTEHVRQSMRTEDGLYRLGGEEFVLLFPGMDAATAARVLPELHQRISGRVDGPQGPVRVSAGAATLRPAEGWSKWLARADNALYRAKRSGRDRLIIAEQEH